MAIDILALALALTQSSEVPEAAQTGLLRVIQNPTDAQASLLAPGDIIPQPVPPPWVEETYQQAQGGGVWTESWGQGPPITWYESSYSQSSWNESWSKFYEFTPGGKSPTMPERPEYHELELSDKDRTSLKRAGLI